MLATGNPQLAVKKEAAMLGANAYVIASDGAMLLTSPGWEVRVTNALDIDCCKRLLNNLHDLFPEVQVAVECIDKMYVTYQSKFFIELDSCFPGSPIGTRLSLTMGVSCEEGQRLAHALANSDCVLRILLVHHTWSSNQMFLELQETIEAEIGLGSLYP